MKITIAEQPGSSGIEVTIRCEKTNRQVLDIVARLRMFDRKVTGSTDGGTHVVNAEDILYVESVDKRTFFYTKSAVYETPLRLYEMEERLEGCDFLRVAKGCVVNFRRVASLRPDLNGRIIAIMDNGEQIVVSRQYAPDVRRKLKMI
ncbi:LytTR family DNA-binding domain-containing protein [Adlercreutzia sp. ZJ138]|uniref:LytTR family DNA-binding domain-containing protein n=1 Tax=Adlercreutzia sp. ZJ138 TaxID=2709405 RepID=UPI0013E9B464|nr:LytTR family DNA-binding domain-containing protein [Adlercreutzia sp. ZJ138]